MKKTIEFKNSRPMIKLWFMPLLLGIGLIALGSYLLSVPALTIAILSTTFSIAFTASGLMELVFAVRNKSSIRSWGLHLVSAVFTLVMGVYLLSNPLITTFLLSFLVAFNLLVKSIQGIFFATSLKKTSGNTGLGLLALSFIGALLSILLLLKPEIVSLSIVVITGTALLFAGFIAIMWSLVLLKVKRFVGTLHNKTEDTEAYEVLE